MNIIINRDEFSDNYPEISNCKRNFTCYSKFSSEIYVFVKLRTASCSDSFACFNLPRLCLPVLIVLILDGVAA